MILPDNTIKLPEFYDGVLPPEKEDLEALKNLEIDENRLKGTLGIKFFGGEQNIPFEQRKMFRPTFSIRGLQSGNVSVHAKTIIPAEAVAEIGIRLVSDQRREAIVRAFKNHFRDLANSSDFWKLFLNVIEIKFTEYVRPYKTSIESEWTELLASAIEEGFNKKPVLVPL